ncbi:MAG: carboxypeptidase M32, partial [Acidimicrobiia bacterium]|nr:carboxypeptidase M32 [Acidimicrobiia bacterium]
ERRTADDIWRSLNVVSPSLIRVEADEVTYNLHVIARFELEKALVGGDLTVDDLPTAWADTYEDLLGVRPNTAADGVLQDIHWSMGAFGYFPTYTIGNLVAAQLFEAATAAIGAGDLEASFAAGEFGGLLDWLRANVHDAASLHLPDDLVSRATGRPLAPDAFLARVRSICAQQYGV